MDRFDRLFWKRLWRLARPYWVSEQGRTALVLLGGTLVLGLASIGLSAIFSYVNRDLTNALQHYDLRRFWHLLMLFALWIGFAVVVSPLFPYLIGRLSILWREWMTDWFVRSGFRSHAFYGMVQSGQVDNPDQRIHEDLGSFTAGALNYSLTALSSIITGATFFGILWSISPWLAVMLVGYSACGTYLSVVVGRRLVRINFDQQRYEADFRFGLVHVRDNAESIAMYGGEAHETGLLGRGFARLRDNFNLLLRWQLRLRFFTTGYDNLLNLMPWAVLAGAYFSHRIELGSFSQAAYAFGAVKGAFSLVVAQFESLAGYATVVNRLATFVEECEAAAVRERDGGIEVSEQPRVAIENLLLMTPDRRSTLVKDLSLEVHPDERLLITGVSGVGKTSLLRAIAGIWRIGRGRIVRPELRDIMFLPQRPHMIVGSLRDQLGYPRAVDASDEQLERALGEVNLADLPSRVGGLDTQRNWPDVLSLGEQQRLGFARLFLNRPRFAFLDEATSALDAAGEDQLYRRLAASPIVFVSVGHRPSLRSYHSTNLVLDGGGSWQVAPIDAVDTNAASPGPNKQSA